MELDPEVCISCQFFCNEHSDRVFPRIWLPCLGTEITFFLVHRLLTLLFVYILAWVQKVPGGISCADALHHVLMLLLANLRLLYRFEDKYWDECMYMLEKD